MSIFTGQKAISIFILLLLLGGGYFFFIRTQGGGNVPAGAVSGAQAVSADEQALIDQLLQLKSLQLNEQIFSDPLFKSLKDFSQPIPPEPVGRPNPFLPVGVGSVRSTGTTTSR